MKKSYDIIFYILLAIQDSPMSSADQTTGAYQPTLLPRPIAYVKEFDRLVLEYQGDGKIIFRVSFILNDDESFLFDADCDDTRLDWRLYEISCHLETEHAKLYNVSWTLLNVSEAMHGDIWKVAQYHGLVDEDEPEWHYGQVIYHPSETPMEVVHTPPTTIFVKGSITDTTVYVDENNVMTINALVTKLYPNGNKIFHEITAAKVAENGTLLEPEVIAGLATDDKTTRDDGLYQMVWKANKNMTDAEYNYTVTFSDIVLAGNVKGSFCVGSACQTAGSNLPKGSIVCWTLIFLCIVTMEWWF